MVHYGFLPKFSWAVSDYCFRFQFSTSLQINNSWQQLNRLHKNQFFLYNWLATTKPVLVQIEQDRKLVWTLVYKQLKNQFSVQLYSLEQAVQLYSLEQVYTWIQIHAWYHQIIFLLFQYYLKVCRVKVWKHSLCH